MVKNSLFFLGIILTSACGALAQIESSGACSVNLSNSNGNNTTIYCNSQSVQEGRTVRLVVGSASRQTVFGNINSNGLDMTRSYISVAIDDEQVAYGPLAGTIQDSRFINEAGEYFYSVDLTLAYVNGTEFSTRCEGVIHAYTSAAIVPFIFVNQNFFTGDLAAAQCGFNLR